MSSRPPVIIIGMHRSGTSLVTRLLEQLGLFVGKEKDENNESLFFQELNEWVLCQAGATWDNPQAAKWLISDLEGSRIIVEYFGIILKSPTALSFFGRWRHKRYRAGFGLGIPWGWKDPRNTFTLPLWLALFPDAKIIHVRRHGIDVAESLKSRNDKCRQDIQAAFHKLNPAGNMPPAGKRIAESPRCLSLEGGFSLWEEYMAAAVDHVARLGSQAKELAYEDILSNPIPIVSDISTFCELRASSRAVENACAEIHADRAFAYRSNDRQRKFAEAVKKRLKVFDY